MSEDLDFMIKRKEAELSPLCSLMEELKLEFVAETVKFASDWYKKTVKQYVTNYPEIILGMSEERIAQMKEEVNDLAGKADRLVNEELSQPALWWHRSPQLAYSSDQYTQVADKYPEIIDGAVRRVLGHLGTILEKHGFRVATSRNTGSYPEFWFARTSDEGSSTVPYFPHLLKWSQQMQDIIRKYNAQYVKTILLSSEIKILKEKAKKQQAKARWDST
jgi:hypothetical protein